MKYFVSHASEIIGQATLAKKTLITSKNLGGVLSALSRKSYGGEHLILAMGRDVKTRTLRWKLNKKLVNPVLAERDIRSLILSYK